MISRLCFEHVCTGQAVGKNLSRCKIYKLIVDPIGAAFFLHFSYICLEPEKTIQVVTGLLGNFNSLEFTVCYRNSL